jgi:hypothetical protein
MTYYLRFENEVLLGIDEFAGATNIVVSTINDTTTGLQVMAFTTRADAENFKQKYYVSLRNFTVSNNLEYEQPPSSN